MRLLVATAFVAALTACGKEEPAAVAPSAAKKPRPEKLESGEPAAVTVKHVLISFVGTPRTKATRTKEEAEKLAYEVLRRAKAGEDFDALMKAHSDDPGGGTYSMANTGVEPEGDEGGRGDMVKAFGDVGFRVEVGEVGFASHDAERSPFGFHVIKRTK